MADPSHDTAIAAALVVARREGVASEAPVVLRAAWHVLLHLRPSPVVARVSVRPVPGGPKPEDVVRELAVASHAARNGAPVIPPADGIDPGPHRHDGHVVAFWRHIALSTDPEPAMAGRALRRIHEALADYEGELPAFGHPEDLAEMLATLEPSADVDLLQHVGSSRPAVPVQALHGDAHLGNCLGTPDGPLWHDFETACRGPREYDLAALVFRDRVEGVQNAPTEALRAYGDHDAELLDAVLPLYGAWVVASMLTALPRRPELAPVIDARLRWLRRYDERR
jgi:Ser/Thr protein kinase RdoA (MazF antagonist)